MNADLGLPVSNDEILEGLMADESVTKRPWTVVDFTDERGGQGRGYIEIQGPNNEKIATIFPFAGIGGVGIDAARQNAILITILANAEASIK